MDENREPIMSKTASSLRAFHGNQRGTDSVLDTVSAPTRHRQSTYAKAPKAAHKTCIYRA